MKLENVTVLDYVDDMAALMHGCDLAILKSGGLTVTECLCAHLPMILLGKSYGQEKANTTMLTGMGASMHVTTARELIVTLRHLARPSRITQSPTHQRRSTTPPPRSRRHSHRHHGARRQTPKAQTSLLPLLLGRKARAYPLVECPPLCRSRPYIIPCSNILASLRNCAWNDIRAAPAERLRLLTSSYFGIPSIRTCKGKTGKYKYSKPMRQRRQPLCRIGLLEK